MSPEEKFILERLSDQEWRLSNLYYIINKAGEKVLFKPNAVQRRFLKTYANRNVILKSRQLGMTTLIQLLMLDTALFYDNTNCGLICHTEKDAMAIFETKIKFPYDNLPDFIKKSKRELFSNKQELHLANNSSIRVGTSLRSSTLQYLHISEFGKISAKFPERAREIVTGAFPTVPDNGFIFVESTAEGKSGRFYEMVCEARENENKGKRLNKKEFKFHFFPWWEDKACRLDPEGEVITKDAEKYFASLEKDHGITLDAWQKAWWVAEAKIQRDDMGREFPSTPDEAFNQAIEGAYYARQITQVEKEGRIRNVPHDTRFEVETWWDLGLNDDMIIIFVQRIGNALHIIDFYANSDYGFGHYANYLRELAQEKGYRYNRHVMPHDVKTRNLDVEAKDRKTLAEELGIRPIEVAPKIDVAAGIEKARGMLPRCYFDEANTKELVNCLKNYRREWDEKREVWSSRPLHDWASHAADAFRYGAVTPEPEDKGFDAPLNIPNYYAV
jgi:hypothetical protein